MYYEIYKEFNEKIIEATKELGLEPTEEGMVLFLDKIREVYKIEEKCGLKIEKKCSNPSGGAYIDANKKIILYKVDLITFLHEVRHFIQFNVKHIKDKLNNYRLREEDAKAWSHSLFYTCYKDF